MVCLWLLRRVQNVGEKRLLAVCPRGKTQLPNGRIFTKFEYFYKISRENSRFNYNLTGITGTLLEDVCSVADSGVPRGGSGFSNPPEIPKALQNRAKLNPIVKTVKNC